MDLCVFAGTGTDETGMDIVIVQLFWVPVCPPLKMQRPQIAPLVLSIVIEPAGKLLAIFIDTPFTLGSFVKLHLVSDEDLLYMQTILGLGYSSQVFGPGQLSGCHRTKMQIVPRGNNKEQTVA